MLTDNSTLISREKRNSLFSLYEKVKPEVIEAEELDIYNEYLFYNMNRPEDYRKIKEIIAAKN